MRGGSLAVCFAALATISCSSAAVADDLGSLAASDTTCREVIQDSSRASRGFVRMLVLGNSLSTSRHVAISVDSFNRPRMFTAVANKTVGTTMKVQMVAAAFEPDGRMSIPTRTFMTRDSKMGTGDSKSVALSSLDTGRVRKLTLEVMRRCVH